MYLISVCSFSQLSNDIGGRLVSVYNAFLACEHPALYKVFFFIIEFWSMLWTRLQVKIADY